MTRIHAGVLGLIVGAVIASFVTALVVRNASANVAAPVATRAAPVVPCPTSAPPPVTRAEPDDHEAQIQKLAAENAQQAALISNNPDGVVPAAFPAGLPEKFRETMFRSVIENALRDCMPDSELVGLSCDEPPCIALIAQRHPKSAADLPKQLDECPAWLRAYGRESESGYDGVDCGGGRQEAVLTIRPSLDSWTGWAELDPAERKHIDERKGPRLDNLLAQVRCTTPR